MLKNLKMQPTEVQKLSPKITVVGVGGAGGNAVNNMISSGLEGCEFLVCNTDAQALEGSLSEQKIQLGANVTGGLGAGSRPEIGQNAAEESIDEVMQYLQGCNMVFVTAGMGGGTGTGAAPVIAKHCRDAGILTVGVVTKPFHFEGSHRMTMADQGIEQMQDYVDTLIVIPNQNLFRIANEQTTFADAFGMADGVLRSGVQGVTDLMVRPGLVNLDFADIRTAMLEMGKAMMGTGEASGDKRAIESAESAINNPLLDDISMKGAHGVIINVTGGSDMTLFEADEACNRIRDEVDPNANIIFGATFDDNMEGRMRVSIVATGIEKEAEMRRIGGNGQGAGAGGQRPGMQRAVPNAQPQVQAQPQPEQAIEQTPAQEAPKAAIPQPTASVTPAAPSYNAIRNIASPSFAPTEQTPVETTAETESDLVEQKQFESGDTQAQNTAMRGTRHEGAFIPPAPVEIDKADIPAPMQHQQPQAAQSAVSSPAGLAASRPAAQPTMGSSMQLNPPKVPSPQEKPQQAPSLFQRIAGSVEQHITGAMATGEKPQEQAAPYQEPTATDAPAGQPAPSEDDLDIPAFLRRQAN